MFILFESRDHFYCFFLLGKGLEISICAKLTGKNGCPCRPSPVIIPRFCVFGKFLGYFSLNRTVPPFVLDWSFPQVLRSFPPARSIMLVCSSSSAYAINIFVVAFTSLCPSPYGENLSVFHSMTARQPFLSPPRSQRKRSLLLLLMLINQKFPSRQSPTRAPHQ